MVIYKRMTPCRQNRIVEAYDGRPRLVAVCQFRLTSAVGVEIQL
jgi:hypothetical protein